MNGVLDGIPFNNSKQVLSFEDGVYHVMGTTSFTENTHKLKCDLIPCRREDLNAGDTAFRSDSKDPDFKALGLYCIILNEREHVFASYSGHVIVSDGPFKYWWKVVPR